MFELGLLYRHVNLNSLQKKKKKKKKSYSSIQSIKTLATWHKLFQHDFTIICVLK